MKLNRDDLLKLCDLYKARALTEHELFRKWQARALDAEARLAAHEAGERE